MCPPPIQHFQLDSCIHLWLSSFCSDWFPWSKNHQKTEYFSVILHHAYRSSHVWFKRIRFSRFNRELGTSVYCVGFSLNIRFWNNDTECWILVECQIFVECWYFLNVEFSLNIEFLLNINIELLLNIYWILKFFLILNFCWILNFHWILNFCCILNSSWILNFHWMLYLFLNIFVEC